MEKSELLSKLLKRQGVPHEVLNAKYHEREAAIVAQAGRKGAVTVATNMAGRGTDIMLGGNPEFLADLELHQRGLSPVETPEDYEAAWPEALEKARRAVAEEHEEVVATGGLYVLGTERHESRRIDNQLRGRSGRQGDPGESRFYLSLEDDLMRLFNADKVAHFMEWLKTPPDVPDRVQDGHPGDPVRADAGRGAELRDPQGRAEVRRRDEPAAPRSIYDERRRVLEGEDLHEQVRDHDRRRRRPATSPRRPPRASPRSGTSTSCGGASAAVPGRAHRRGGDRGGRRRPVRRCPRSS